jgi:hypothetical protein
MLEQAQTFPSREEIERRAYEIYLQRGGTDGSDVADWILAEEELRAASKSSAAKPSIAKTTGQTATHT